MVEEVLQEKVLKQAIQARSFVLWFTGLSGAGKSTLANAVGNVLREKNVKFECLDGDIVRDIFPNTGFSKDERNNHIRRVGFLASMLERNGVSVVCSFISPYQESRQFVRDNTQDFIEVYLDVSLEVCETRDPKGLYRKVRRGEIKQFTGVDDPYEPPRNPEIRINTAIKSVEDCVIQVISYLKDKGYIEDND